MAYKVKNIREVFYRHMSEGGHKTFWRLDDLRSQQMTTSFDDGDYFALYEDVDRAVYSDTDHRKYAVYLHNSGELLCLLADCAVALSGYDDTDYGNARSKLYKQIAIAAGWPEKLPKKKRFTVRIVREFYVEVHADSDGQAWSIGKKIEEIANEKSTGEEFGYQVKSAVNDTCYELADAWPSEIEDHGTWELRLNEEECERILKED